MRRPLLRHLTALVSCLALAAGFLTFGSAPAQAASFSVSVSASVQTAVVGQTVTLAGKVGPKPSSRTLYLQRRFVGSTSWATVKKFKAAKSGAYKVVTSLTDERDRYYRVYKKKAGSRKAGHSRAVQVIVNAVSSNPASVVPISPATQPLAGGSPVTITGARLTGTTKVTMTPQVPPSYTQDGTGILPELPAKVTVIDDNTLQVIPPASLGGPNLVKIYTPSATLVSSLTYARTDSGPDERAKAVLDEVNLRRSTKQTCRGVSMPAVGPLAWDGELSDLALSHARDLAARQSVYKGLSHTTYGLKEFSHRFALAGYTSGFGEDLVVKTGTPTAAELVDLWMASTSGHCESVMRAGWTKAGIGVADGPFQGWDAVYANLDLR